MRVTHLLVIAIRSCKGMDPETTRSAQALFMKHGQKAETSVLIQTDLFTEHKIIKTAGETPFALGAIEKKPESTNDSKEEKPTFDGISVGVYLVFHNETEGQSIFPSKVAEFLKNNLPEGLAKQITKVSMIACNSASDGPRPDLIEEAGYAGKSIAEANKMRGLNTPIMIAIMFHLQQQGINPKLCGFDVPVFIGGGDKFDVKKKNGKVWDKNTQIVHPLDVQANQLEDLQGSKLVQSNKQGVKAPMAPDKGGRKAYKDVHKKVMYINDEGAVAFVLGGWSAE